MDNLIMVNYDTHLSEYHKQSVIESNKRRANNIDYQNSVNLKRQAAWTDEKRQAMRIKRIDWFINNPGEAKRISLAGKKTQVTNILIYLDADHLSHTSTNFMNTREKHVKSVGTQYPTYQYAKSQFPDLLADYIDDIVHKHKNQLAVEARADKIINYMRSHNMTMNYGEFDKTNKILYSDAQGFIHREVILNWSPNYLDDLDQSDGEKLIRAHDSKSTKYGHDREYHQNKERLDNVISKMKELNLEMTYSNFDKANKAVYPGLYSSRKLETMLEHCNDYSELFINDRPPKIEKHREQIRCENMINKIYNYMKENDIDITMNGFIQTNVLINPNPKGRKDISYFEKWAPSEMMEFKHNHKVKSIEFIELDNEEAFYDITVDSEYPNFPLAAGVFVHNSGVAKTSGSGGKHDKQEDIISGMSLAQKIFHDPESLGVQSPATMTKSIFELFNPYKAIQMVHYEILISSMMWKDGVPWRLNKNRSDSDFEWVSILKIPSYSSWLLGAAFSNLKNKLLDGVIRNRIDESSSITELFRL
jgi:hypothetical protein